MHLLFIHQAFPAQFGRLGLELHERFGWQCTYLVQDYAACPTPTAAMLEKLTVHRLNLPAEYKARKLIPWAQTYGRFLELCAAVYRGMTELPDVKPDLVVCHDGLGPGLFLPDLLSCPVVNYCEYYFAPGHADISYRLDLPPAEPAQFYPRCINAGTLVSLIDCAGAYAPTEWQRKSFPERFRPKIEVHFDGIDTQLYLPRRVPHDQAAELLGRSVPRGTRIVTFAARGFESIRGFDLFMRLAARIAQERPDVLFVVIGSDEIYYSWDKLFTGEQSFREWVLARGDFDLSRFVFTGQVDPERLADLLCLSDLHIYLTAPFVPSWSLLNALACGCVVLGSDVAPVREVIEPGRTGLVTPLFDLEAQTEMALRVLDDPAAHAPLGAAGRRLVEQRYSLDVCVPDLKDYFTRMAQRPA
jgi:glycosyltransferase involved in cell wall biosynthesis